MTSQRWLAALVVVLSLLAACAEDEPETSASDAQPSETPTATVLEDGDTSAPEVIPAEEVFAETPAGFRLVNVPSAEATLQQQLGGLFERAPSGVSLHSVAARRVTAPNGDARGSAIAMSLEVSDASVVQDAQAGLLRGVAGSDAEAIDVAGTEGYLRENATENGQELVVFFHEDTVVIQVYGLNADIATEIATAIAETLA